MRSGLEEQIEETRARWGGCQTGSFGTGPDGCFNDNVRRMREFCEILRSTLLTGKKMQDAETEVTGSQNLTRLWLPRPATTS